MNGVLAGKRILFFAPAFFGYENKIAEKLEEMGAAVDRYDVRSVTSAKDRALLKISPGIFFRKSRAYYKDIIEINKKKDYDYILIVKCDMTPKSILSAFRQEFPHAKLCLYLWDSVDNIPGIRKKFRYFDVLHSFDKKDCEKYPELKFRPLFFADDFCKEVPEQACKYDISFLGTIHSDRYAVIKEMKRTADEKGLNGYWFCYLQSRFIYYFYKMTKKEFAGTKISDFSFEKMTSKELADIVAQTDIVLDIQHPKQTGLTMRTIETIGMKKKLITTNRSIVDYAFYSPNNIRVIDRKNITIDEAFLRTKYEPLSNEMYRKYSLRNWVLDVLEGN